MSTAFPLATGRELGYHREQVDGFLDRARSSYEQAPADDPVTSAEIRRTAFPLKRKGYSARYVDAALDRLEEVFFERERRARVAEIGEEAWWDETRQLLSEVRGRLGRPAGKRFKRRGIFATGYRRSEVDAFLDLINSMLHGESTLTTVEVRGVVFHSQWRGYSEDQVDALLDAVIVLMLSTR
ncbi:MAG: DivIVA domain-containing protein [Leucobacter sp.]